MLPRHPTAQAALDAYLATRPGLGPEHPLFVSWRGRITTVYCRVDIDPIARQELPCGR